MPKTTKTSSKKNKKSGRINLIVSKLGNLTPRSRLILFVVVFAVIGGGYYAYHSFAATPLVGVYRVYNATTGEHFFTTSQSEEQAVQGSFKYEDMGFYVWSNHNYGAQPIYRLRPTSGGKHLYTASLDEKNELSSHGWTVEGVAWYAYTAPGDHLVPVYRLFNKTSNDHLFTTSSVERDKLVSDGTYNFERVAFWVAAERPGCYPRNGCVNTDSAAYLFKASYWFTKKNPQVKSSAGYATPTVIEGDGTERGSEAVFVDNGSLEYHPLGFPEGKYQLCLTFRTIILGPKDNKYTYVRWSYSSPSSPKGMARSGGVSEPSNTPHFKQVCGDVYLAKNNDASISIDTLVGGGTVSVSRFRLTKI
jgi:hypothetical protein